MVDPNTARKEFIRLGWWLLEHKAMYYLGEGATEIHPSWLRGYAATDAEYDRKERRYDALAFKLGEDPTVSDMVGFCRNRPCCQLVLAKLKKPMPIRLLPERRAEALFG